MRLRGKRIILLVGILLTLIAIILTLRIYLYKEEIYSLDYGLPAYQLIEPLKKWI